MARINVSHITLRDGTSEELHGFDEAILKEGMAIFIWKDKVVSFYPIDTIKNMVSVCEEE